MIKIILLIGLGGGIGSIVRYLGTYMINKLFHVNFPLGTLIVNILGCLLVGLLIGFFEREQLVHSNLKYLFITGFCGGFTTFSAFSAESIQLFESGSPLPAILYISASVLIGLLAVWLGLVLVK